MLNLRELLQSSSVAFLTMLFNEDTNPSAIAAAAAEGRDPLQQSLAAPPTPGTPLAASMSLGASISLPSPARGGPSSNLLVSQSSGGGVGQGASNKVSQGAQFRNQVCAGRGEGWAWRHHAATLPLLSSH